MRKGGLVRDITSIEPGETVIIGAKQIKKFTSKMYNEKSKSRNDTDGKTRMCALEKYIEHVAESAIKAGRDSIDAAYYWGLFVGAGGMLALISFLFTFSQWID